MWIVTWTCRGIAWSTRYATNYHAEQYADALRGNGLWPIVHFVA